jgi:hypothetical protein
VWPFGTLSLQPLDGLGCALVVRVGVRFEVVVNAGSTGVYLFASHGPVETGVDSGALLPLHRIGILVGI